MATSVRLLGPTAHGKALELSRVQHERNTLVAQNEVMRAALVELGVDVDALLARAQVANLAHVERAAAIPPAAPRTLEEAPIGGTRAPARVNVIAGQRAATPAMPAATAPIAQVGLPPVPPGHPGIGAIIRNPDGSSVQLLPNVTRGAQAAARAPAPPAPPAVVLASPQAFQAPDPARQAPRTEILAPAEPSPAPPADDTAERFRLIEID